ncbi:MAG: glucose-6-phosphate isomerase [Methanoregulaceae archaeon]|nr:glucose-6-phosphate isomerase [Methanoregulaceae archaeon]
MRSVLADPGCQQKGPLYFMYRDLAMTEKDRNWLQTRSIRFDITVIPSRILCGELVKTKGHYHPPDQAGTEYPELYEVIEGTGHFLLQNRSFSEIILVEAKAGDKILISPGFGHVTVNPGKESLVMANLVSNGFSSDYGPFEVHQGAAYYEMAGQELVKNPRYPEVPEIACIRHGNVRPGSPLSVPLYDLVGNEERLEFLNRPEAHPELFPAACQESDHQVPPS